MHYNNKCTVASGTVFNWSYPEYFNDILSLFADITDPVGDVHSFIAQFIETYGEPHPEFFDDTYSQVTSCEE